MKYEIVHLNGFMYAVGEIVKDHTTVLPDSYYIARQENPRRFILYTKHVQGFLGEMPRAVIATTDSSLNLPLLPTVIQSSLNKEFQHLLDKEIQHHRLVAKMHNKEPNENILYGIEIGYKAAFKQFTEEDVKRAFEAGHDSARLMGSYKSDGTYNKDLNSYIQSLKPKPVAVELEMENKQKPINYHKDLWVDNFVPAVNENNYVTVKQWHYE